MGDILASRYAGGTPKRRGAHLCAASGRAWNRPDLETTDNWPGWKTRPVGSSAVLRPMLDDDVRDVLQLNADHVELLAPLDGPRLLDLRRWATRADVIVCEGQ